jgi:hypothetical protein
VRASVKVVSTVAAAGLTCAMLVSSVQIALSDGCKPSHFRAPFFIKSMGACSFDSETLSFAGTPVEQAKCLMRGMDATRNLAQPLDRLPPALASRVGATSGLPSREALSSLLSSKDLEWDFAAHLWQPVSRAHDNDPDAPMARYFVIHDTSGPNYGHRSFPGDIDNESSKLNNLNHFACPDGWGRAHVFISRTGEMLLAHDYGIAWRETKFEQAAEFGGALQGLFLHNELVQPRQSAPGHGGRNDARSPDPAFTAAQYDRLALLYTIASVRADRWLIPAFHAALDADIPNGHDDPLNFDVESFANSLDRLVAKLEHPQPIVAASLATPTTDAVPENASKPAGAHLPYWGEVGYPPGMNDAPAASNGPGASVSPGVPNSAALSAPKPQASELPPPPAAKVALAENESHREQKSLSAEDCTTHVVKGHRRRVCGSDRAERRESGRHAVRSVDRLVSREGHGPRHHGGDVHTRHARGAARHDRA